MPPLDSRRLPSGNQRAVLAAIENVREGRVFDLGTELRSDMPTADRTTLLPFRLSQYRTPRCLREPVPTPGFDFSMDVVEGSPHQGTHIDAFVHVQASGRIYGGLDVRDVFDDFGWRQHGVETIEPIVTSGRLLDVARQLRIDPLPDGFEITPDHIEHCLSGSPLRKGDAVLIRTGKFTVDYKGDGSDYFSSAPGVGTEAAIWLHDRGMSVLGTDTSATEPTPLRDAAHTVHRAMLVERGVHLIEIMNLDELAASGATSFMLICLPLKIRGATGSWVRPIAII
jgi:kynurenine formamidase